MRTIVIATCVGIAAVALQVAGRIVIINAEQPTVQLVAAFLALVGVFILVTCVRVIAVAKGRHPGWSALGLLSIIGLVIVLCLKDRRSRGRPAAV